MRVAIAAVALLSAAAFSFFACSSEEPATSAPSDAGNGRSDGGASSGDPPDETDAGVVLSPSGCPLKSTGFASGSKADNVARPGVPNTVNWTDVTGALAEDGKFATVTLADGQESSSLRVSDFKLAVPEGMETWGIEVELKRRAVDGGIEDSKVEVEIEGEEPRFKFLKGPWPRTIVGTHRYGQAVDTWGVDLFPADVNKASFAAKVSVKRAEGVTGPVTAIVDSLKVAVHYCKP